MARRRTEADAAVALLREHGVEPRVEVTGKNHLKLLFEVDGERRMYVCAGTPSDFRGLRNTLAGVRRLLRGKR